MSPLRTLRQIIRPTGQHRAPTARQIAARPVIPQAFRPCAPCGTETAAVLHRDGHTCGTCGHTTHLKDGAE